MASGTVLGVDTLSGGAWNEQYGQDGRFLPGWGSGSLVKPAWLDGVVVTNSSGSTPSAWNGSGVGLEIPNGGRHYALWYDSLYGPGSRIDFSLTVNDARPHCLSLFLDIDNYFQRLMEFSVRTPGGSILGATVRRDPLPGGEWIRAVFSESILFRAEIVEGRDALFSALLFGPCPQGIAGLANVPGNYVS